MVNKKKVTKEKFLNVLNEILSTIYQTLWDSALLGKGKHELLVLENKT
jgi:hypothetical protein